MDRWIDKSPHGNHAVQAALEHQPTLRVGSGGQAANTVRFDAARQQFLSAGHAASLNLSQLTAFVVARAASDTSNMWLFGKNDWGPPWTGYGIAVSRDGLHPWPHLGLGRDRAAQGAQLRHRRSLGQELGIVEICYDGQRFSQCLQRTAETGAWWCVPASSRTSGTCSSVPGPSPPRRANTSRARSRRS